MAGINLLHHFGGSDIIENGSQDVTGSAAALPDLPVKEVLLQADPGNVIDIYVGRDTVTVPGGAKPGITLSPGSVVIFKPKNLNQVYVLASTTGAKINWLAEGI